MRDLAFADRGGTLLELLIAIAAASVLIAMTFTAFLWQTQTYGAQNQIVVMEQTAIVAVQMLNRDLRMAGYSPVQGVSFNGITYDAARLLIAADLNGNGVTTDLGESITYSYNAGTLQLVRNANGFAPAVLSPIQGFALTYWDATGATTTVSANIRQVGVSVIARTEFPDPHWPANNGFRTLAVQIQATPRNLGLL